MTTQRSATAESGATVAAYDIARLAGVGRAAVSNWRRRFTDFPRPVGGTSASPLFALADVEAWLVRHGKQFQVKPGDQVWQQMRGAIDDLQLGELIGYIGGFLLLQRRNHPQWTMLVGSSDRVLAKDLTGAITTAVPELPAGLPDRIQPEWARILRLVAEHAGHRELFDSLCERYLELHARRYSVTPAAVAELMVDLAAVTDGVVLDPACGVGTLLLTARSRGAQAVWGQEANVTAARLATTRLLLADGAARVAAGDSLRRDAFADVRADAVVCNPPFNERSWGYEDLSSDPRWEHGLPPRGEPELAWVQHCLTHVHPGRPVVIMMPASAAGRRAGRRIRGNLLRAGALRAVISLPSTGPGAVAPDLWLLVRPDVGVPPPSHVLMVDATMDLAVARDAWDSFRSGGWDGSRDGDTRTVRIIDLLDDMVDVSPARHLAGPSGRAEKTAYPPTRIAVVAGATALATAMPELTAADVLEPMAMTTVGELVKAGLIVIQSAPLKMPTDGGDLPVLTVSDVRHGRPPSGRATAEVGSVVIAAGDVITPAGGREPVAWVATDGGALLGPQLLLFRVDAERVDPHFLAGFLRAGSAGGPSRGASLLLRTDARRTPIPRLALAQQRAYGEAFRQLTAFEQKVRQTAADAEQLVRLGFAGLADGTLRL